MTIFVMTTITIRLGQVRIALIFDPYTPTPYPELTFATLNFASNLMGKACITRAILRHNVVIKRHSSSNILFCELKIFFREHFVQKDYVLKRLCMKFYNNILTKISFYCNIVCQNVMCDEGLKGWNLNFLRLTKF